MFQIIKKISNIMVISVYKCYYGVAHLKVSKYNYKAQVNKRHIRLPCIKNLDPENYTALMTSWYLKLC